MDVETHRHRCEVREWLRRGAHQDKGWLVSLLQDIAKKRGKPAAERIKRDFLDQWRKGSRGEPGVWL